MNDIELEFREAIAKDLPSIIEMLANDPLGSKREEFSVPLLESYQLAFAAIDQDPNNELIVVCDTGEVIGVLQMTFIPYLTYKGSWRALIEGVRVAESHQSKGVGQELFEWAIERAKERKCRMLQLTTDKARADALRFYERLGFKASHEGMKLHFE